MAATQYVTMENEFSQHLRILKNYEILSYDDRRRVVKVAGKYFGIVVLGLW